MNFENVIPILAGLVIVTALAAPVAVKIVANLREGYRIRQHKKNLPGPLLGVVYPTQNKKDKKK